MFNQILLTYCVIIILMLVLGVMYRFMTRGNPPQWFLVLFGVLLVSVPFVLAAKLIQMIWW